MRHKKATWGIVAAVACLAAVGLFLERRAHAPHLPADADIRGLPAAFRTALDASRAKVVDGGFKPDDLRALARLYQANRLNSQARACYAIIGPVAATAHDHYYLAGMAEDDGDLESAAAELRGAIKIDPQYRPARLALADVLFKSGQPDAAEGEYKGILALEANQPQALYGLARIELQRGNDDAAVARLGVLMASHPEMTSGAGLLAQVYDRRGDKERAEVMRQWSRQKPEPVPSDPWMEALLTDCYDLQRLGLKFEEYFTSGEVDLAVPLIGRIAELDPASPIPHILHGWTKARDHDDAGAVQDFRKALDSGGDPEKICPYLVASLLALGRVTDAASLLAEYHAKKPDSIPILIAYSDVAVREGDTALSRRLLTDVLTKEPYLYAANMSLAKILWTAGEKAEAVRCLKRAAEVSASDIPSRALLGEYYLGAAQPESAIPPLEEALAHGGAQGEQLKSLTVMLYEAYLRAGSALEQKGNAADAVASCYEKAIRLAPSAAGAYARKAAACASTGQFQGAADALTALGALQPSNATVFLSLGDVQYQDGRRVEARINWQKAMDLAPADAAALRNAAAARLTGPITEDTFK
jgi:tetratricopeptide (TPR) repeat protein